MPTVLDTHAWLWWVTEDRRLSKTARRAIDRARANDDLWLSLISIWEVAKKIEKGQLALDRPLNEWLDLATAQPGLSLAEVTRAVLVASCQLPRPCPADPADQIIVATTRNGEGLLVSKDRVIRAYPHVRSVW
jgi:PIN domain nuclease of toxin-antitoxin system